MDCPGSVGELRSWFPTGADCLDYLDWLRWPDGFVCPRCGHAGGWLVADGRYKCAGCGLRTSVTAGTLFDRRRTPLTVWFEVVWAFASGKDGISALSLQRTLEIGSYVMAWAMLHRLRAVLVRPGRDRLTGTVEVDETYIGGQEPGLRGGRARGKEVLVAIAIEVLQPRGFGRCRMQTLTDASARSLHAFISGNVEPGAHVITDGWNGYVGIEELGYTHERRSQRAAKALGEDPGKAAARRAPGRLPGQAVAAGHPPVLDRPGAPAVLPERVRLPVQPATLRRPRHALLPRPAARRGARAGALQRTGRRPEAQAHPAQAADSTKPSAEPGPSTRRPSLARDSPRIVRSDE